jgi:rare lipoprotein A
MRIRNKQCTMVSLSPAVKARMRGWLVAGALAMGAGTTMVAATPVPAAAAAAVEVGSASFYHNSLAGRKTASGEPYRPGAMTAAHKKLPLGTRLRVTNLANGKQVVVKVNDRGPYAKGRILDLSRGAAEQLGFIKQGHTKVRIEVLG